MCGIFDSFVFGIEPMRPQRYNYFLNYARNSQKKVKNNDKRRWRYCLVNAGIKVARRG